MPLVRTAEETPKSKKFLESWDEKLGMPRSLTQSDYSVPALRGERMALERRLRSIFCPGAQSGSDRVACKFTGVPTLGRRHHCLVGDPSCPQ